MCIAANCRLFQEAARLGMRAEQGTHAPAQFIITLADLCESLVPLVRAAPCLPARQRCLWRLRDSVVMAITIRLGSTT